MIILGMFAVVVVAALLGVVRKQPDATALGRELGKRAGKY